VSGRSEAYERFMASTRIDYEKWHDGEPYDLDALERLQGEERADAERWLLGRANRDWRDLEGLLVLGTERARAAVVEQLHQGTLDQRLAAAARLPDDDPSIVAARETAIVEGLLHASFGSGLSAALDLAVEHATPAVVDALFRAALRSESAVHAAAALAFIHGRATEPFDWARRPFFLQFAEVDPAVREAAFEALCGECGVDPARYSSPL
jgi:hypothetical protein